MYSFCKILIIIVIGILVLNGCSHHEPKGNIIFKVVSEGTQGWTTLYLNDQGVYQIHSSSFFTDHWVEGIYKYNCDTLFLKEITEKIKHNLLSDTMLIKDKGLYVCRKDTIYLSHFNNVVICKLD